LIRIPGQAAEAILVHAHNCLPNEACGLLAFDSAGRLRMVYPLTNSDPSPVGYTIDPVEHFRALQHAERQGWELAGAFHSHVNGPAVPSSIDIAQAVEPEWLWLVAGPVVGAFELRGYRIVRGEVTEEEVVVSDP
jgi:proteasome lid subunit RPN8/RPN11